MQTWSYILSDLRPAHWLLLLRLAALLALVTSAALFVDYTTLAPSFCGGTGCAGVRQSGFGYVTIPGLPFALPVPALGLAALSLVFGLSLIANPTSRRRLVTPLALALAVVGVVLLGVQFFVINQVCALCVIVDLCCIAIGAAAFGLRGEGWHQSHREEITQTFVVDSVHVHPESQRQPPIWSDDSVSYSPSSPFATAPKRSVVRLRTWGWAALGALAIASPLVWPHVKPVPPVAPGILAFYEPGKVNVVEFADFQCPYCRNLHGRLKELLAPYGDRANLTRLHMPLPHHPMARDAAKAALCAEEQGRGEGMADHLFSAAKLDVRSNRAQARELGLDVRKFDECVAGKASEARLERDAALLREVGFEGLPTTYIGGERFVGALANEVFADALDRTARGEGKRGVPGWTYLLFCSVLASVIVYFGRSSPPESPTSRRASSDPEV